MTHNLIAAVCQMTSIDNVDANVEQMTGLLDSVSSPFQIAFFPENCLYMRIKEGEPVPGLELDHPVFLKLKDLAKKKNASLHLGSVPLKENGKLTNATVLITADGQISCTYRKMHLFDITLEGQKPIRESDVFNHGPTPSILDLGSWKVGQTICYDLRFSELFSFYAKNTVDLIVVPSAFLVTTGKAHWEVLLRARAIESQCFVIAAAQAGTHSNSQGHQRKTFGHSLVVNPWGEVVAVASADQPEVLLVELDRKQIDSVRRQIPMQSHRRL